MTKKHDMTLTHRIAAFWVGLFIAFTFGSFLFQKRAEATFINPYIHSAEAPISDNELGTSGGVEEEIKEVFGEDWITARAIFKAESGLNPKAMNWNCEYKNEKGEKYYQSCHKEDRGRAWSVDCGLAQLNFKGKVCPEKAFDYKWNIREAYYQKFKASGWSPWYAYKNGSYLAFMPEI